MVSLNRTLPLTTSDGQQKMVVTDGIAQNALNAILLQLRINNAHLEMVTGEPINEEELDAN